MICQNEVADTPFRGAAGGAMMDNGFCAPHCGARSMLERGEQGAAMETVFVSYGHGDYESVIKRFADDLKNRGFRIWIDYECLRASGRWEEEIERGITESSWVVVFMTTHSMRRPDGYCLDEVSYARLLNKRILPLKIQEVAPPLSIARIQWLDVSACIRDDGSFDEERYGAKLDEIQNVLLGHDDLCMDADGRYRLERCLSPLDNESLLRQGAAFYGREWLFDEYAAWLESGGASRVFCVIGQAGSGKTAFAARLCELSSCIVGIHFCRYNNNERADPKRAIMSLAFHLSTQLPEYRALLCDLPDLEKLQDKSTSRLFEYLLIEPLNRMTPPSSKMVIAIDALDEAANESKNELVNLIVNEFGRTPSWLGLVVTSRPERDLERKLSALKPVFIANDSAENMGDIRGFLRSSLGKRLQGAELDRTVRIIADKSQGSFLYATEIVKAVEAGSLLLRDVDRFPEGLVNVYSGYFERLFGSGSRFDYRREVRSLLEVLCACCEPLDSVAIADLLDLDEYELEELEDYIYVLFPQREGLIEPIHKSLVDWLLDKSLSGGFHVSSTAAHTRMASYAASLYGKDPRDHYAVKYISRHLLGSRAPLDAVAMLVNADLQDARIALIGQDSAIRAYLDEVLVLSGISREAALSVLRSDAFLNLFRTKRRYLYNAGLHIVLKRIGFDDVLDTYTESSSIDVLAGCVNYLYITEEYERSSALALDIVSSFEGPAHAALLAEIENEIALSFRKLVRFDDALVHCEKVFAFADGGNLYEVALAHQTVGKILYHRLEWDDAYDELCQAVGTLEEALSLATDGDYRKMLNLYIAAFEREVALSLVWQGKTDRARRHLDHAKRIYDEERSVDRYYVRCLYVEMFADFVDGRFEEGRALYLDAVTLARSNYDVSQIEFYYAMGLHAQGRNPVSLREALSRAASAANKIDAYLERSEILLLGRMVDGSRASRPDGLIGGVAACGENGDIERWIDYVGSFIQGMQTKRS